MASFGRVTLVGAGPGDPDLLTVRAIAALNDADVVLYDALVDPRTLDHAPNAAHINVGKRKQHGCEQAVINELLVTHVLAGKHVVRLKGGDPSLFGRATDEIRVLEALGVVCTIVPGVSAVSGAAASALTPLTDRDVASSVLILSGHRATEAEYDWEAVAAAADTIVVYMGVSTAALIAQRLIDAGRRRDEPVLVVSNATADNERHDRTTLEHLAGAGCDLPSPAVIVIGAVVDWRALTR